MPKIGNTGEPDRGDKARIKAALRTRAIGQLKKKPEELLSLWRDFQKDFLKDAESNGDNLKLVIFCKWLISNFNNKIKKLSEASSKSALKYKSIVYSKSANHVSLAGLINKNIPLEIQQELWEMLPTDQRASIIREQKNKYGSHDFENSRMPRIITEATKKAYMDAIHQNPKFINAGFRPTGLGFAGAVFGVMASEDGILVPSYVLKVPAPRLGIHHSQFFAWLTDEYPELLELTDFSADYVKKYDEDHFSQTLAGITINKKWNYLGVDSSPHNSILASVFRAGENIYETADEDRIRKSKKDPNDNYLNPYITHGISDQELVNLMRYYQELIKGRINFYEAFPHNMHYVAEDQTLRFIDAVCTPRGIHTKIMQARETFPIDCCIFDIITFLAMHEQKHAFAVTIRTNIRQTIRHKEINTDNYSNDKYLNDKYTEYLNDKFEQIQRCLDKAISQGIFTKKEMQDALDRLADFHNHRFHYGSHYKALSKDFERLTDRGKSFINRLRTDFRKPKNFLHNHKY